MSITPASPSLFAHWHAQRIQAFTFACIAGYVDAHALLRFHVYASFMSGNTTHVGVDAVASQLWGSALSLLAILFFVIGAFLGCALLHSGKRSASFSTIKVALVLLILDIVSGTIW